MSDRDPPRYVMRISPLVIDKLGVRLYDKASAVIAELIANSYDADATEVVVEAPMGEFLAIKGERGTEDRGFVISISDNGHGMTRDEANDHFLFVGRDRRLDPNRGNVSKRYKRKVMGRKGVGKLAPFGICRWMEVITSSKVGDGPDGSPLFVCSHFVIDRDEILKRSDTGSSIENYGPDPGALDGTFVETEGTKIILSGFDKRKVPELKVLHKQIAQRFGLKQKDWRILLRDSLKPEASEHREIEVGDYDLETLHGTKITLDHSDPARFPEGKVCLSDGTLLNMPAGFYVDGVFNKVSGWIARSTRNYRDDLMAGVRIYCRGKIAAQTPLFGMRSGFTGEYEMRSYLVGMFHADWLDEEDDLIQTDRQDILWSSDLGEEFARFGQTLIRKVGQISENPRREQAWERFSRERKIADVVERQYPGESQKEIRDNTLALAQLFVRSARDAELNDSDHCEQVVQLSILFGPYLTLDEQLKEAAGESKHTLETLASLLRTAKVAELTSYGKIAQKRVNIIQELEKLKDDETSMEGDLQRLLTSAPWLINPSWSPITENRSFTTFVREFAKFFESNTGTKLSLPSLSHPKKQPDFVLASDEGRLEVVEIKKPGKAIGDSDIERLMRYFEQFESFFNDQAYNEVTRIYSEGFHITLVCDEISSLNYTHISALELKRSNGRYSQINWSGFLAQARRSHKDFMHEYETLRNREIQNES